MGVLEKVKKLVSGSTHRDAFSDVDKEEFWNIKSSLPIPVRESRIVWVSFQYKRPTQVELLETDRNVDHLKKRLKTLFPRHIGHLEAFEFGLKIHPDAREMISEDLLLAKLKVGHDASTPLYIWLPHATNSDTGALWNTESSSPRPPGYPAGSTSSSFMDVAEVTAGQMDEDSTRSTAISPAGHSSDGPRRSFREPPGVSEGARWREDVAAQQTTTTTDFYAPSFQTSHFPAQPQAKRLDPLGQSGSLAQCPAQPQSKHLDSLGPSGRSAQCPAQPQSNHLDPLGPTGHLAQCPAQPQLKDLDPLGPTGRLAQFSALPQPKHPDLLGPMRPLDENAGQPVQPASQSSEPGQLVRTAAVFYQHELIPEDVARLLKGTSGGIGSKVPEDNRPDRNYLLSSSYKYEHEPDKWRSSMTQHAEGQYAFESVVKQQMARDNVESPRGSGYRRSLPSDRRPRSIFTSFSGQHKERRASMDDQFVHVYNNQSSDFASKNRIGPVAEQEQLEKTQRPSFWSVLKGSRRSVQSSSSDAAKRVPLRKREKVPVGRPKPRRTKSLEITHPTLDVSAPVPLVLQKEAELNPSFYAFLMQARKQVPGLLNTSPSFTSMACDGGK